MSEPKYYECAECPDEDGWYWVNDDLEKILTKRPRLFFVEHFDDQFQMSTILEDAETMTINLAKSSVYLSWYGPISAPEAILPRWGKGKNDE